MRDAYSSVVWKRVREVYGPTARVFGDEAPKADDIVHGTLENAYMLTVMSAMAA